MWSCGTLEVALRSGEGARMSCRRCLVFISSCDLADVDKRVGAPDRMQRSSDSDAHFHFGMCSSSPSLPTLRELKQGQLRSRIRRQCSCFSCAILKLWASLSSAQSSLCCMIWRAFSMSTSCQLAAASPSWSAQAGGTFQRRSRLGVGADKPPNRRW